MALRNKKSAMNKMSRCRTRNLAPVHSRRGRECDCEFRANRTLMRGGGKERRRKKKGEGRKKKGEGRKKRGKRVGEREREEPALYGEKGLVRDWTGKTMNASGVEDSVRHLKTWKGRLDLRFASARCLEIVCRTIATPTSARIVERVTVGSTSACRTILRSSLLVVFLFAPGSVFRAWVPSRIQCSQQFLTAHSELSTWPATRHVDQPAVFISMIRPLSNSLNCEKCLLARLLGSFRLPKSSYNWQIIVTFMNLRICAGLYSTLFLIVAPPLRK
ncbi:uncharacterized protein TNCV_4819161 [Trichonephila clavipes]|nr:uncharacterized protein TNCV_4819161 [Trichonephila clavipes]